MSDLACKLFDEVMQLSEPDRRDLAARLIDSIGTESEEEVAAAWEIEIQRRMKELDSGEVKTIPWEQVKKMLIRGNDVITEH